MSKLALSIAVGNYDRMRPLMDGEVAIDGVDPLFMALEPEEIFFRAFRHADFDVCELSLSSFALRTARGDCPYVGLPVFPSRAFRHTAIYVRTDRIRVPEDLRGKRVGVPEYQLTANVWARALLEDEHGVAPEEIVWVRGGLEQAGRVEKNPFTPPPGLRLEAAPEGATLSGLLAAGAIDGIIAPRAPSCFGSDPNVGWLYPDTKAAASDYFRRTGIFPLMHLLGLRRALAERHPFLPMALVKAFTESKRIALARLADPAASKVSLPFAEEWVHATRALMGEDFWSYGLEANRAALTAFLQRHHREGLSPRALAPEELFHPATAEHFRI
ncbi:MAG: ABC transporter substrate-binding protein [Rhodospirillales bacterium]|nr:ABC transporter substrate-binding protein [Rhodospirillales bacterium]